MPTAFHAIVNGKPEEDIVGRILAIVEALSGVALNLGVPVKSVERIASVAAYVAENAMPAGVIYVVLGGRCQTSVPDQSRDRLDMAKVVNKVHDCLPALYHLHLNDLILSLSHVQRLAIFTEMRQDRLEDWNE